MRCKGSGRVALGGAGGPGRKRVLICPVCRAKLYERADTYPGHLPKHEAGRSDVTAADTQLPMMGGT